LNFEGRQIEFILVGNSLDTAMDMPQTEPNENEIFAGSKAARVAIRLREVSDLIHSAATGQSSTAMSEGSRISNFFR